MFFSPFKKNLCQDRSYDLTPGAVNQVSWPIAMISKTSFLSSVLLFFQLSPVFNINWILFPSPTPLHFSFLRNCPHQLYASHYFSSFIQLGFYCMCICISQRLCFGNCHYLQVTSTHCKSGQKKNSVCAEVCAFCLEIPIKIYDTLSLQDCQILCQMQILQLRSPKKF